jgi:dihydrofolate synthase/folylpolyglutamate synthase
LDYRQSIDHLLTLVDLERNRVTGPRQKAIYNLERMQAFLDRLGSPHKRVPSIHVAGTKGKGSTAAFCDSALRAAGLSTGFYSSPHLHSFRERIRRDSQPLSEQAFSSLVEELWPLRDGAIDNGETGQVTLFEFLTGMAFHCFDREQVDVQTIEVGLGGRLDATNVLDAAVCVITSISLDHTAVLGDNIAQIAADKAGIIKPGATAVIAPQAPEALKPVLAACDEMDAKVVLVGRDITWQRQGKDLDGQSLSVHGLKGSYDLELPLLGDHQLENAATAVAALEMISEVQGFPLSPESVRTGFKEVSWPCRMEVLSSDPLLVADGAHNVYSVDTLLATLPHYFSYKRLILVTGISYDKNVEGMVDSLAAKATLVYATASRHPRSLGADELTRLFVEAGADAQSVATPAQALEQAKAAAGPNDLVLATGSLFLAAEIREAVLGIEPEIYPDLSAPRSGAN